jgi:peptidoglycan hydrolase-like protein with peptidoglycan-binding domain
MILSSKVAWAGIVFLSLTAGISGPRPTVLASGDNPSKEGPTVTHPNDVKQMQRSLRDKAHYSGQVDGVVGLRTRASIRGFQKTENLPVTGQLDAQTAGRLGVEPERRELTGFDATFTKPSAGIGSRRVVRLARRTLPPTLNNAAGQDREKKLASSNRGHEE